VIAIEDERRAGAMVHLASSTDRAASPQQPAGHGAAVHRTLHCPAAHDQGHGRGKPLHGRPGKREAPAGDDGHVDTRLDSFMNGPTVGVRQGAGAVKQSTVEINADKSNC
jgi:hypothetical protein